MDNKAKIFETLTTAKQLLAEATDDSPEFFFELAHQLKAWAAEMDRYAVAREREMYAQEEAEMETYRPDAPEA